MGLTDLRKTPPIVGTQPMGTMMAPRLPMNRKLSVSEMMAMRQAGGPNMSGITDAATKQRLSLTDAAARMPKGGYQVGGWDTGEGGHHHRGGSGGYSGPRSHISSTGVAGGIPTSQRGRAELSLDQNPDEDPVQAWQDAEKPAYQQASDDFFNDAFEPNPRYGNMGKVPTRGPAGTLPHFKDGTADTGPRPRAAVVGENGQETVVLPPHSAVLPHTIGSDTGFGTTALDEIAGPQAGEIRKDTQGNDWRYDSKLKRGIPVNPYAYATNAPSRNAFQTTALDRYDDLSNRLAALRQEGMAEGRAKVADYQARIAGEQAKTDAFLAGGTPVATADGGGRRYTTKYGSAIVGGTRPKSFTVENWEGGQTAGNLAEAERESRADAAERTVRGLGLRSYRGYGTPVQESPPPPAAIDELMTLPRTRPTLADDTPGNVSRSRRAAFLHKHSKTNG